MLIDSSSFEAGKPTKKDAASKYLVRSRKRHPRCLPGVRSSSRFLLVNAKYLMVGKALCINEGIPAGLPILNSDSKEYMGRLRGGRMKLSYGEVPAERKALVKSAEEEP